MMRRRLSQTGRNYPRHFVGAGDEFDNKDDAPLPPHERSWRHPAEVSDALRLEHTKKSAPPPIGRRAAALVAFVSLVASATLVLVTVQKGVKDPVAEPAETSTTSLPAKGRVDSGTVVAVPAFDHFFVVPTSEMNGINNAIRVLDPLTTDRTLSVKVVTTIAKKGISIVTERTNATVIGPPSVRSPIDPEDAHSITAVDRLGRRFDVNLGIHTGQLQTTSTTSRHAEWFPLDVDGVIDGVAALYADGAICAIAVRHDHAHFAITLSDLKKVIDDAIAGRNG